MLPSDSLHAETVDQVRHPGLLCDVAPSAESWPFLLPERNGEASHAEDQFSLICDNVQFDVAGHRSLLADLGKMIQTVLGLAGATTHDAKEQTSI